MGLIRRLRNSVNRQGIRYTLVKAYILLIDLIFDLRYGVETCRESLLENLSIRSENMHNGTKYVPARVMALRGLFSQLRHLFSEKSVLVDLGSGKGRVMLIASEFGFKKVRGIEFAHELAESSRKNTAVYQSRSRVKTEFKTIEGDVTHYTIQPDEDVFFLNNPFDKPVLSTVLENISTSLEQYQRKVHLIYFCPTKSDVIEAHPNFQRVQAGSVWGYQFILYANVITPFLVEIYGWFDFTEFATMMV